MTTLTKKQRTDIGREVLVVYVVILLIWGCYRLLFRLPVVVEEVGLKAIVFGGSLVGAGWWRGGVVFKRLGLTANNLTASVYLGVFIGVMLGIAGNAGNIIRHGGLSLSSYGLTSQTVGGFIILSLITGFWEQLLFCGYILSRLEGVWRSEWVRGLMVALLFAGLHIPAYIFVQRLPAPQLFMALGLLVVLELGNVVLMLRYKNLAAPVMAHALWGITVFLFR